MTFRESMADDFEAVFANTAEFGESVNFQSARGGEVRAINVLLTVETTVGVLGNTEQLQDAALVEVAKDATTGILRPELGDTIWRPDDGYDPLLPFNYQGIVEHEDPATWTLRYVRLRPFRANASASGV